MSTDPGRVATGEGGPSRPRPSKARQDPFAELWEKANHEPELAPVDDQPDDDEPEARGGDDSPRAKPAAVAPLAEPDHELEPLDESDDESADDEPAVEAKTRRGRETVPIKARQVYRLIRSVDPWSVLRVSFLFYLSVWLVCLVAGLILWQGASSTNVIDNVEKFVKELFGLEVFRFNGPQIFRASVIGGLVAVIFGSAFTALLAVLFNLIADLTGGIRLTVIEVARARPRAVPEPPAPRRERS